MFMKDDHQQPWSPPLQCSVTDIRREHQSSEPHACLGLGVGHLDKAPWKLRHILMLLGAKNGSMETDWASQEVKG